MRKLIAIVLMAGSAFSAFADDSRHTPGGYMKGGGYAQAEIKAIFTENSDTRIGEFEVGEIGELLNRLSVAAQNDAYVAQSQMLSFMVPGLGELKNGDVGAGVLFLLADTAVTAGTLLGAYFLLPQDLLFDQLDYFNASYTDIKNRWESHSFMDYLPTMGVMTGGWLLSGGLRFLSAKRAGEAAKRSIDAGKVTFEPKVALSSIDTLALGIKIKY
jgi:hypothetical protein